MEFMDLEDQQLLRDEILALLGLTHAPENRAHRVNLASVGNNTVSHFMLDVYRSLTSASEDGGGSEGDNGGGGEMLPEIASDNLRSNAAFRITDEDIRDIVRADVIMSFANRGRQDEQERNQQFWFDTNELPSSEDEQVIRAELRYYTHACWSLVSVTRTRSISGCSRARLLQRARSSGRKMSSSSSATNW